MFKCLVAMIAVFPGAVLAATIWTWVDDEGRRHYSDREVPGATQLQIGESQTFSGSDFAVTGPQTPAQTPAQAPEQASSTEQAAAYTTLEIISPEPEENLWNIGGSLPVTVVTFPALATDHQIDISIDGERRNLDTRALQITVPDVFRGEHSVQALIIDSSGETLMRSAPVTIFVHQTSLLN